MFMDPCVCRTDTWLQRQYICLISVCKETKKKFGEEQDYMSFSSFHFYCLKIIKQYIYYGALVKVGLQKFYSQFVSNVGSRHVANIFKTFVV